MATWYETGDKNLNSKMFSEVKIAKNGVEMIFEVTSTRIWESQAP